MNITAIKMAQVQNVKEMAQAVTQKEDQQVSNLLPQISGLNISAMASAIKEAQNKSLQFNGTVSEYVEYAKKLALAGELNLDKESYKRTVTTNDGNTYNVEISNAKVKNTLLFKANLVDSKDDNFDCRKIGEAIPVDADSVEKAKENLAQLKQKYGEI